jgi:TldD protein
MVANDLGLAPGMCGKMGQSVPVSVGQPTIRIAELLVGGTRTPLGRGQMQP